MKTFTATRKDLYYTREHEWINFQGSVAYVGICLFKLKGVRSIEKLEFHEDSWLKKKGEVIATIHSDDDTIPICMPIDGKIINLNNRLLLGDNDVLLSGSPSEGWVALIAPAQPYERKGLLPDDQYRSLLK